MVKLENLKTYKIIYTACEKGIIFDSCCIIHALSTERAIDNLAHIMDRPYLLLSIKEVKDESKC